MCSTQKWCKFSKQDSFLGWHWQNKNVTEKSLLFSIIYILWLTFQHAFSQQVCFNKLHLLQCRSRRKNGKRRSCRLAENRLSYFIWPRKTLLLNLSLGRKNEGTLTTIVLFPLFSKSNYPKTLFFHMQTQPTVLYTNVYFLGLSSLLTGLFISFY